MGQRMFVAVVPPESVRDDLTDFLGVSRLTLTPDQLGAKLPARPSKCWTASPPSTARRIWTCPPCE